MLQIRTSDHSEKSLILNYWNVSEYPTTMQLLYESLVIAKLLLVDTKKGSLKSGRKVSGLSETWLLRLLSKTTTSDLIRLMITSFFNIHQTKWLLVTQLRITHIGSKYRLPNPSLDLRLWSMSDDFIWLHIHISMRKLLNFLSSQLIFHTYFTAHY